MPVDELDELAEALEVENAASRAYFEASQRVLSFPRPRDAGEYEKFFEASKAAKAAHQTAIAAQQKVVRVMNRLWRAKGGPTAEAIISEVHGRMKRQEEAYHMQQQTQSQQQPAAQQQQQSQQIPPSMQEQAPAEQLMEKEVDDILARLDAGIAEEQKEMAALLSQLRMTLIAA